MKSQSPARLFAKVQELNKQLDTLRERRNAALLALRQVCQHERLAECDNVPPYRFCIACGAEERGWHAGYQVLLLPTDTWWRKGMVERILVAQCGGTQAHHLRPPGDIWYVGQSDPNYFKRNRQ